MQQKIHIRVFFLYILYNFHNYTQTVELTQADLVQEHTNCWANTRWFGARTQTVELTHADLVQEHKLLS